MKEIVLFGVGKTAQLLFYHFEREGHTVAAFTADKPFIKEETLFDRPVISFDNISEEFPPMDFNMMIAVGYVKGNRLRSNRVGEAEKAGYNLISYVSPTSIIWDQFQVQSNCKIGEHTIVQPFSSIGKNVFIGSGCIIGHHTVINDNCFLASGVIIGGGVEIGQNSFLGIGSNIRNDISIGEYAVIGTGVTIQKNIAPNSVYIEQAAEKVNMTSQKLYK